jgi:hypothetical protein
MNKVNKVVTTMGVAVMLLGFNATAGSLLGTNIAVCCRWDWCRYCSLAWYIATNARLETVAVFIVSITA